MNDSRQAASYWRSNLTLVIVLLAIWAVAGFGLSIFLIETVNQFKIGSVGFGFWMAQQGSIYVFCILIFVYVRLMNKLDKEFDVDEK